MGVLNHNQASNVDIEVNTVSFQVHILVSYTTGDKPFLDGSDKRARPKISLLDEEIEPAVLVGEEEDEDRKGATGKPRNEDRLFVDEEDHSELLE